MCINLDPINFGILFFSTYEMMLHYYIHEYKCTFMFKILCNWAIPWDPHFNNYYLGHTNNTLSLSSLIYPALRGGFIPHVISHLLPFSHLLLRLPFLFHSQILHGLKTKELEDLHFSQGFKELELEE